MHHQLYCKTYLASSRDRACRSAPSVQWVLALVMLSFVGSSENPWSDVSPGSVVQRLLLEVILV